MTHSIIFTDLHANKKWKKWKIEHWNCSLLMASLIIVSYTFYKLNQKVVKIKSSRKSPQQDFTYVFLKASYRRFTRKSHCKLALFVAARLLKVHDKVTTSFHDSFLTARFLKVHEKVTISCRYLLLIVVTNYWKFTT